MQKNNWISTCKKKKKKKPKHKPYILHKNSMITSKWITYLNVKHKTIKILDDNIEENPDNLGFGDDFFRYDTEDMIHERDN